MAPWPTTVMGLKRRYDTMYALGTGFDGILCWHLVLLMFGTLYNPDQEYFYDNVWADLALNSGTPKEGSIYSYVDLFTWRGWIEETMTIAITNFFIGIIIGFVGIGAYVAFYALTLPTQYKFCQGKEIAWGISGVYEYYPCESWDFLSKF